VFGDLKEGSDDSRLTLFGREDAELARAGEVFVPLDNLEGHRLDTMMLWFEVRNSVTAI
jgi:hypothetical protein